MMTFVIVAAAAIGGWLGFGLRKVIDGDGSPARVATVPSPAPTVTFPTSSTSVPSPSASASESTATKVRFVVKKATYVPATSESGVRRNRARLAVALSVRNRSTEPYTLGTVRLLLGGMTVRRDPQADEAAGPLTQPIPPDSSAVGELRFETAGELTTTLASRASVKLIVDGRRVTATITK